MMDLQKWYGILDTYSTKWGASINVVDFQGQLQYSSSEVPDYSFPADEWETIQHLLSGKEMGFCYETAMGYSWFISPILDGQIVHCIILVGPVSNAETLQEVEQLTSLLADVHGELKRKKLRKSLLELTAHLKKGDEGLQTIPDKILSLGVIDLIGIAFQEKKDSAYQMEHVWGEGQSSLQHTFFQYGQGLLGYAAAMGKTMVWNNVKEDPRSAYFRQHGISLETLMCFPIKGQSGNGVLFFGTKHSFTPDETDVLLGELIADEVGKQRESSYWKEEEKVQRSQIQTLSEICHVMTETDNVQQILYMIMDISLYLVGGKFCAIVWFDHANQDRANIFARGISQERLANAGKSILKQWKEREKPFTAQPSPLEEAVYEIPLFFRDTCYGVMMLDFSQIKSEEGYLSFFRIISIITGMALNHVEKKVIEDIPEVPGELSVYVQKLTFLTDREQEVLALITQGKNNKDIAQTLYISENTVKNHITNILRKLGVTDRSQAMAAVYQKMTALKTI